MGGETTAKYWIAKHGNVWLVALPSGPVHFEYIDQQRDNHNEPTALGLDTGSCFTPC